MAKVNIINQLIEHFNYTSYLEIGIQHKATFDKVKCKRKIGIDPNKSFKADYVMTSDEFFSQNKEQFDIIFVDGLHEKEQGKKDIFNALQRIPENGTIVVHDCNPANKTLQDVPRHSAEWCGDIWKAWMYYRQNPFLNMFVIDNDYGIGIIRFGQQKTIQLSTDDLTYENLKTNRKEWLNLVGVDEWRELL